MVLASLSKLEIAPVSPKATEDSSARDANLLALQVWRGPACQGAEELLHKAVKAQHQLVLGQERQAGVHLISFLLSLSLRQALTAERANLLAAPKRAAGDGQIRGLPPLPPATSPKVLSPAPSSQGAVEIPVTTKPRLIRHSHNNSAPGSLADLSPPSSALQSPSDAARQPTQPCNPPACGASAQPAIAGTAGLTQNIEERFAPECIRMGVSTNMGQRLSMEDFAFAMPLTRPDVPGCWFKHGACFGVFDGHGGAEVAQSLVEHVPERIQDSVHSIASSGPRQMGEILLRHEHRLRQEPSIWSPSSSKLPPNLPRGGHVTPGQAGSASHRAFGSSRPPIEGVGMRRLHSSAIALSTLHGSAHDDQHVAETTGKLTISELPPGQPLVPNGAVNGGANQGRGDECQLETNWSWPPAGTQPMDAWDRPPGLNGHASMQQPVVQLPPSKEPSQELLPLALNGLAALQQPIELLPPSKAASQELTLDGHTFTQQPIELLPPSMEASQELEVNGHISMQQPVVLLPLSKDASLELSYAVSPTGQQQDEQTNGHALVSSQTSATSNNSQPPNDTSVVLEAFQSCPSNSTQPSAISQPERVPSALQGQGIPGILPPHTRSQSDVGLSPTRPCSDHSMLTITPPQLLESAPSLSCCSDSSLLDMPWPGHALAPSLEHTDSPLPHTAWHNGVRQPQQPSAPTPSGPTQPQGPLPWGEHPPCSAAEWEAVMHGRDPGSTALVATVIDGNMFVANVGDCRLILGELDVAANRVVARTITNDHVPTVHKGEAARLAALSVPISDDGYVGAGGGFLQVSRSIGDFSTKTQLGEQVILSEPELHTVQLCSRSIFVVAASDGITCAVSDDTIVNQVCKYLNEVGPSGSYNDPSHAAEQLVRYAIDSANSSDNASAIVTCFKLERPPLPQRPRLFGNRSAASSASMAFLRESAPV